MFDKVQVSDRKQVLNAVDHQSNTDDLRYLGELLRKIKLHTHKHGAERDGGGGEHQHNPPDGGAVPLRKNGGLQLEGAVDHEVNPRDERQVRKGSLRREDHESAADGGDTAEHHLRPEAEAPFLIRKRQRDERHGKDDRRHADTDPHALQRVLREREKAKPGGSEQNGEEEISPLEVFDFLPDFLHKTNFLSKNCGAAVRHTRCTAPKLAVPRRSAHDA